MEYFGKHSKYEFFSQIRNDIFILCVRVSAQNSNSRHFVGLLRRGDTGTMEMLRPMLERRARRSSAEESNFVAPVPRRVPKPTFPRTRWLKVDERNVCELSA